MYAKLNNRFIETIIILIGLKSNKQIRITLSFTRLSQYCSRYKPQGGFAA